MRWEIRKFLQETTVNLRKHTDRPLSSSEPRRCTFLRCRIRWGRLLDQEGLSAKDPQTRHQVLQPFLVTKNRG